MNETLPHKISSLVFLRNPEGRILLIERRRPPNAGLWSPIGGKLDRGTGESPHQTAARETWEETGLRAEPEDFHLFGMIAERAYEGGTNWLMFLFVCRMTITALPPDIDEGRFAFFSRGEIDGLAVPETDRAGLWKLFDEHRDGFVALRADCTPGQALEMKIEEVLAPSGSEPC